MPRRKRSGRTLARGSFVSGWATRRSFSRFVWTVDHVFGARRVTDGLWDCRTALAAGAERARSSVIAARALRSSPHFSPRFKKGGRSREKLPRSLFGKERAPVRTVVRRAAAFSRVLTRAFSDCEQTSTSADGIALTSLVAGGAQMRSG